MPPERITYDRLDDGTLQHAETGIELRWNTRYSHWTLMVPSRTGALISWGQFGALRMAKQRARKAVEHCRTNPIEGT